MNNEAKQIISSIMFEEALPLVASAYAAELKELYGDLSIDEVQEKVKDNWAFLVRAANEVVQSGTQIIANKLIN